MSIGTSVATKLKHHEVDDDLILEKTLESIHRLSIYVLSIVWIEIQAVVWVMCGFCFMFVPINMTDHIVNFDKKKVEKFKATSRSYTRPLEQLTPSGS